MPSVFPSFMLIKTLNRPYNYLYHLSFILYITNYVCLIVSVRLILVQVLFCVDNKLVKYNITPLLANYKILKLRKNFLGVCILIKFNYMITLSNAIQKGVIFLKG